MNESEFCPECGRPLGLPIGGVSETLAECKRCSGLRPPANLDMSVDTGTVPGFDVTIDLPDMQATAAATPNPPGRKDASRARTHVGRFRIRSVLGKGAFGTVYRAYDPVLDREVALKTPRFADDDPKSCERFLREAKAAAKLRHPNIVAVFESGEAEGEPYIAAEFVDGTPLSTVLKNRTIEVSTTVDWMRQIAEALDYAHSEGIVHRDIKPANMMVCHSGRPQLMDFGLAKRFEDSAGTTTEGTIVGTPAYMAPEQARGKQAEVGPASDQYSLGVVLYEMLCGRTPYLGDAWSVVSQVSNPTELPPAPRALKPGVPRDLEACCLKALEKNPAARYPSMKEFAADLDRWLQGQPLVARPIGVWERLQRWRRRNKLAASLLTAIATIVMVTGIAGYVLAFRFRDLAAAAEREAVAATKAKEEEEDARERERHAKLGTERLLIDSYATSGLSADRNDDASEALLWFANAAARSDHQDHADRLRLNEVRLYSWIARLAVPVRAFQPPGSLCEALRYHSSGRYFLCESLATECEVRDLVDDSVVPLPLKGPIQCGVWSPNGKQLALASESNLVLFEFPGDAEIRRWNFGEAIFTCGFSPDGQRIAVAGDQHVQVYDVASGEPVSPPLAHDRPVLSVRLNRDGSVLATVSEDRIVRVYGVSSALDGAEPILPPQPSALDGKELPVFFLGDHFLLIPESGGGIDCWDTMKREIHWRHKTRREAIRAYTVAASPDEKYVAVGGFQEVVILDSKTGVKVGEPIKHRNMVHELSFSPDGLMILSGGLDSSVRISKVPSGESIVASIPHFGAVYRSAWSPDGATFATIHWGDNLVRVWKLGADLSRDFVTPDNQGQSSIRLNADSTLFLSAGIDAVRRQSSIRVRQANDGRGVGQRVETGGAISDATFVANSTLIAWGGSRIPASSTTDNVGSQNLDQEGVVQFVDYMSGELRFDPLITPSQPIAVRASPDGRVVVVLCHAGQVLLIDGVQGTRIAEVQAFAGERATHGFVIRDRIRFSPNGEQFAIWGTANKLEVRRTRDGEKSFAGVHASMYVHDVRFSPDGSRVASCSSDKTARLWSVVDGKVIAELPHGDWVFHACFSRDGKKLLTASRDRQARLWDVERAALITATTVQSDEVFGVCFSPTEEFFLLATRDRQISVWDPRSGSLVAPIHRSPVSPARELELGASGTELLAAGQYMPATGYHLPSWIREPEVALSVADTRMLGELLSGKRVYESGAATSLSRQEWLDRWNSFQQRHPKHPVLQPPSFLTPPKSGPES